MLINEEIRRIKKELLQDNKNMDYYNLYLKYLHKMKREYRISNNKFVLDEKIKKEIEMINSRATIEDKINTIRILLN